VKYAQESVDTFKKNKYKEKIKEFLENNIKPITKPEEL